MAENTNQNMLTQKGKLDLEKKLKQLVEIDQPKAFEELNFARSQGDLSENSDYDAAREKTEAIKAEITRIQYLLDHCVIVDEETLDSNVVSVGSKTITVKDVSTGKSFTFQIVGSQEADPLGNKISNESPVGRALLGHKVGEKVHIDANIGYDMKIVSIK